MMNDSPAGPPGREFSFLRLTQMYIWKKINETNLLRREAAAPSESWYISSLPFLPSLPPFPSSPFGQDRHHCGMVRDSRIIIAPQSRISSYCPSMSISLLFIPLPLPCAVMKSHTRSPTDGQQGALPLSPPPSLPKWELYSRTRSSRINHVPVGS